jgi:hypothetical protein
MHQRRRHDSAPKTLVIAARYGVCVSGIIIKLRHNMNKNRFLAFCMFLCCILVHGQDGKVRIFQGRRQPFMPNKIMDLSFGNLKEIPILPVSNEIEILILDNNKIEHLPSWIGTLKNLRILSVRNNNLVELNSKISFCENLEQLYLSGNSNLADLPSLSSMEKLEIIDVSDTKINEVPGWVKLMDCLYYFKFTETKK